MRTIADLHDRIIKAFQPAAPAGQAEEPHESVVPAAAGDDRLPAPAGPLAGLMSRLRRRAGPSLKDRLNTAEAVSAAKSRRIATVVHEIRTPLNGILGMTHLLGQTKLTAEQQNYLSGIRQSGHMLAQLVDDILDLSTMEAGRFRLNARAENIRQLIESVVEMLSPRAHEKRIEIAATFAADLPELMEFDPTRLRQVLFNVVGNAVKFTAEGGVLIRVAASGGNVEIAVIDTGAGMTADEQALIFGEFEQAGSAETRSGGTGLGLGITSRILTEFDGSLSVSSRKGEGSTFTIRFPISLAADVAAGGTDRSGMLSKSRVLLLAPHGPAAEAAVATIEALGGRCRHIASSQDVSAQIDRAASGPVPYTDLIVDHRLAAHYAGEPLHRPLHRILLVNPEERASQPQDLFDAWLIRPLREKSLIDVLTGRMRGFARVAPSLAADEIWSQPAAEPAETVPAAAPLDILLAEDDPVSAMLVRAALQKQGHRVRWVSDATSFADAVRSGEATPDFVITDMNMPGGDPVDVVIDIRRREQNAGASPVPVIALTGDAGPEIERHALSAGAQILLRKPVDPAVLIENVGSLLANRKGRVEAR